MEQSAVDMVGSGGLVLRPAHAGDVQSILQLLAGYVRLGLVRERTAADVKRDIGGFIVAVADERVVGCVALRVHSASLVEVASLAVSEEHHGLGIGRRLVQAAVLRAHARGVRRLFAFTLRVRLFEQLGFRAVPLNHFPQKLATDYGGTVLSAGHKVAVVLDLEAGGSTMEAMQSVTEQRLARPSIAILGGGNLGRALAMGWTESGFCSPGSIRITRRRPDKLTYFAEVGFSIGADNHAAVEASDIIVLAVQPQQIGALLDEIRPAIDPERHRIISVVSGVTIAQLREPLQTSAPIVRAMPNTAVSIGESMTCLASQDEGDPALTEAQQLFDLVGRTLVIPENMMIPATALCACGIAFFLRAIRAASQGGIEIGFHPEEALLLAAQTAKGAASLLLSQGRHPESEIDQVTTPRGCTIAGLNEMEHQGFSSAMIKGILLSARKAEGLYEKIEG